jgi:hypothetical protein
MDIYQELPTFDAEWLVDPDRSMLSSTITLNATAVRNVAKYIQRIHATAGKGGHNATFRVACRLRDAGLSQDEALALLTQWNETNAHPPWSEAEIAHKITSAFARRTR